MSNYFSFWRTSNSISAHKAATREIEETREDEQHDPFSQRQLQTQLVASPAVFQSPAVLDSCAEVASAAEPMPPQFGDHAEPFNQSHVHFNGKPPSVPHPRTFNSADEAAALAVPIPTNSRLYSRSLSKVFTVLPTKPLPSYPQMVLDQVEYLMHVILLETDFARAVQLRKDLEAALQTCTSLENGRALLRTGRLLSRLHLTTLACDVVTLSVDEKVSKIEDIDEDDDDEIVAASDVPSDAWNTIQENLIFLKGILLRQNANAAAVFGEDTAPACDLPDEQLAKHVMMTADYEEVIRLLAVQVELARLKEQLQEIGPILTNSVSKKAGKSPHRNNKLVEKIVNQFMTNLSRIFPPDEPTHEDDDDDFDDIDDDDDENDDNRQRRISNIPKELHDLVLTELYSPKQQPQEFGLVDRLLADVMTITSDAQTPALTRHGLFSYAHLQAKVRTSCS